MPSSSMMAPVAVRLTTPPARLRALSVIAAPMTVRAVPVFNPASVTSPWAVSVVASSTIPATCNAAAEDKVTLCAVRFT